MSELYHYGIKGQTWGNRRFQDYAGKLTAAGRERYGIGVSKAKYAISTAKKTGRFGVALGKAKGEHYRNIARKAASRGVYEASKRARNISSDIERTLSPKKSINKQLQKNVENRLRNVRNQMAYSKKRSVALTNLTGQADYKKRYDAGRAYIDSLREVKLAAWYGSDSRFKQRSDMGKKFVYMRATKAREVLASGPSSRTTLSNRGKNIAARRAVDWVDDEYSKVSEGWQKSLDRHRKRAKYSWSTARGM